MDTFKGRPDVVQELLGPLHTLLERGAVAYRDYSSNGKCLLYAKVLKDNNERIRELLLAKAHLLPVEQRPNAIALVAHIDTWHVLWEDLYQTGEYGLGDEFAFENKVTFPRACVESLSALYLELAGESR